jgi:hypothetical protein
MHVNTVWTDACLAAIAEFGAHQAFDRSIQIGIIKHDEGCIAAQFQRQLFQSVGRFARQILAHCGGTREGDFANPRVLQPGAYGVRCMRA